jgi:hypothetical protein
VLGIINQVAFEWESLGDRLRSTLAIGVLAVLIAVPLGTDRRWAHWIAAAGANGYVGWRGILQIFL